MPFPQRIAHQDVAIVMESPAKRDLAASLAGAAAGAGAPSDIGVVVGGGGSHPHLLAGGSPQEEDDDDDELEAFSNLDFPQDDPRETDHQDVYEQWEALTHRASNPAYAITTPLPAEDEPDRQQLCTWTYEVVDRVFDLDRCIVASAMAHFDRLVSSQQQHQHTKKLVVTKGEWSPAALACLHIAIKMHVGKSVDPTYLATLSRGYVNAEMVSEWERRIFDAFDWYLNPPVSNDFLVLLLPLLESGTPMSEHDCNEYGDVSIDARVRHRLVEQAKFLSERSVLESFFSTKKPSSVACAAILVAMDLLHFPADAISWFLSLPLEHDEEETEQCVRHFHAAVGPEDIVPGGDYWADRPSKLDTAAGTGTVPPKKRVARTVTPTKGDVSTSVKRRRHEADLDRHLDTLWEEEGDDGEMMAAVLASPRKVPRIHKKAKTV